VHLHNLLTKIAEGKATPADIERLEKLGDMVRATALCGLGQTAPNPVFSTLKYFRDEYAAHIERHQCPAGVCAPGGSDTPGSGVLGQKAAPAKAGQ
jgi:hypothetical protein